MTEPDGQDKRQRQQTVRLIVAKDGSGNYDMVGVALRALRDEEGPPSCIFTKEGVYREWLEIRRPGTTLGSQSAGSAVITGGLSVGMTMEDGSRRETFRIYSVLIDTHDFTVKDLTTESSVGPGEAVGQALALYADEDQILLKGCRLPGGQDALFTGPLSLKEVQKNGFIGPKQLSPRTNGRHCYQDCLTRGDIDPISGSATVYFDRYELYSANRDTGRKGCATAASTPKGQKYGYMFRNCWLTGNSSRESIYLGKSWRDYARAVLTDCYLGPHIRHGGRHDWGKKNACSTLLYGGYGNYGSGVEEQEAVEQRKRDHCASKPDWVFMLIRGQIQDYTTERVLGGVDGWNPRAYI